MELRRAVISPRFLLGMGLMLSWTGFNAAESVGAGNAAGTYNHAVFAGVTQLLRLSMGEMGPVLLALATIPYSFSYLTEREWGFQEQAVQRIGITAYGICKAVAVFLSGFLMGVAATGGFVGILSAIGIPHTVRYGEVQHTYAMLVITMGPGWYYAVKLLHIGLVCGQAAVFSLMVMSWIPNVYVGFLSPMIGCYLADCIQSLLAEKIYAPNLWCLTGTQALFFGQGAPDPLFSYLWTVAVLSLLALVFGGCFLKQIKKELAQ